MCVISIRSLTTSSFSSSAPSQVDPGAEGALPQPPQAAHLPGPTGYIRGNRRRLLSLFRMICYDFDLD